MAILKNRENKNTKAKSTSQGVYKVWAKYACSSLIMPNTLREQLTLYASFVPFYIQNKEGYPIVSAGKRLKSHFLQKRYGGNIYSLESKNLYENTFYLNKFSTFQSIFFLKKTRKLFL